MSELEISQRFTTIEAVLAEFIIQTNRGFAELRREMSDFKDEIQQDTKALKDEFRAFKDEMKEFKDEMKEFKDEMKEFKDEMKEFKTEMSDFKTEVRDMNREKNKQWGELANKMGTLVEDIVIPAIRPAIQKYFHLEVTDLSTHRTRNIKAQNLRGEFDVVAVTEKFIFIVEVKSSPNQEKIMGMQNTTLPRFRQLFPEYQSIPLIPVMASLRFDDNLISFANQTGVLLLAYREWDYMDFMNFEDLKTSF